jgi:hypothetical protein
VAVFCVVLLQGLLMGLPAEARRKPEPQRPVATSCCRVCTKGCACGNACISCNKVCRKPPGCACNAK